MIIVQLPRARAVRIGAACLVAATALTACGGGPGSATTTAAATTSAAASIGRAQGRFNSAELQKIRDCLSAAGISMPTPTGGFRTRNPTDRPTARPSNRPSGAPTGGARFRAFADPKVRAALEACGITLPTGRPTPGGANPTVPGPTVTG